MKPRSCIICRSKSDLFSFPKAESEKKKWAAVVKKDPIAIRDNLDKICKHHFSPEQFKYNSKKRLKPDAIPSLNFFNADSEQNEEHIIINENLANLENGKRRGLCLVCGTVFASSFHRFPKTLLLKQQWAKFCGMSILKIESYHRLCSKHFELVHDRDKVPTLYPREHIQCDVTSRSDKVITLQENIENIQMESENIPVESENITPECSTTVHSDFSFITPQPFIYFKRYGDITEQDVVSPRRAVLSLKMGKAELDKCRKKLKQVQSENRRLKIKIETLEQKLSDFEQKHLLSKQLCKHYGK